MRNLSLQRRAASMTIVLVWVGGCAQTLMPTPNLLARAPGDPFADVPPARRSSHVNVLYATDREPVFDSQRRLSYGYARSQSLSFGTCDVEIGRNLAWDDLLRASRSALRLRSLPLNVRDRRLTGAFPPSLGRFTNPGSSSQAASDDAAARAVSKQQLIALVSQELRETPKKEAFIYIHGFDNSFDYAACVIAQIWHFMGRPGVAMVYSWPAGSPEGLLGGYTHDRESGEFTGYHLKQFLKTLAACPELEKIHLVAHSRGTDVLVTALRELNIEYQAAGRSTRDALKLGNVVLAAADLDTEVVSQRIGAEGLTSVPERVTLYVSGTDRAIRVAELLFGSKRRIGQLRYEDLTQQLRDALAALPQLQIVDARVSTGFLGHDYFYSSPAVSSDLILLLRDNRKAGEEHGRPLTPRQQNYFEIRDDYLR